MTKIYTNGQSDWRKINGDPYTLFAAAGVRAFMNNYDKKDVRFLLGHNRSATTGDQSTDCAHPFTRGNITLMHNGTLDRTSPLLDFQKFPVDSDAICNSIDKVEIEKTLGNIKGAYSLVYYDGKAKKLHLIRNKERPLYLGVHMEMGRIYFASEHGMLRWVLGRNNITTAKIEEVPEDQLISFSLNEFVPEIKDMTEHVYKYKHWVGGYEIGSYKPRIWNADTQEFDSPIEDAAILAEDIAKVVTASKGKKGKGKKALPKTALTVVHNPDFLKPKGVLNQIDQIFGYKRGSLLTFTILDYTSISKEQESWRIEGEMGHIPAAQIFTYVKGNAILDKLLEAKECTGVITNMQYNLSNKTVPGAKHRMWVKDCLPVLEDPKSGNGDTATTAEVEEATKYLSEVDKRLTMEALGFAGLGNDSIN